MTTVMSAAAKPLPEPDDARWAAEVDALLRAAPTLSAAARASLLVVLDALVGEASLGESVRRDARRLREALRRPAEAR